MENLSTQDFLRRPHSGSRECWRFILKYETMREAYDALLHGKAGDNSLMYALWVFSSEGVAPEQYKRLLIVQYARRVGSFMTDNHLTAALDVAEKYATGEATEEELETARNDANNVVDKIYHSATNNPPVYGVDYYAALAAEATAAEYLDPAWCSVLIFIVKRLRGEAFHAERHAQLRLLRAFGNPFEEWTMVVPPQIQNEGE